MLFFTLLVHRKGIDHISKGHRQEIKHDHAKENKKGNQKHDEKPNKKTLSLALCRVRIRGLRGGYIRYIVTWRHDHRAGGA